MLVLSRKQGEKIVIGKDITVTVVEVTKTKIRIGIDAPDHVRILRAELAGWRDEPVACNEQAGIALLVQKVKRGFEC